MNKSNSTVPEWKIVLFLCDDTYKESVDQNAKENYNIGANMLSLYCHDLDIWDEEGFKEANPDGSIVFAATLKFDRDKVYGSEEERYYKNNSVRRGYTVLEGGICIYKALVFSYDVESSNVLYSCIALLQLESFYWFDGQANLSFRMINNNTITSYTLASHFVHVVKPLSNTVILEKHLQDYSIIVPISGFKSENSKYLFEVVPQCIYKDNVVMSDVDNYISIKADSRIAKHNEQKIYSISKDMLNCHCYQSDTYISNALLITRFDGVHCENLSVITHMKPINVYMYKDSPVFGFKYDYVSPYDGSLEESLKLFMNSRVDTGNTEDAESDNIKSADKCKEEIHSPDTNDSNLDDYELRSIKVTSNIENIYEIIIDIDYCGEEKIDLDNVMNTIVDIGYMRDVILESDNIVEFNEVSAAISDSIPGDKQMITLHIHAMISPTTEVERVLSVMMTYLDSKGIYSTGNTIDAVESIQFSRGAEQWK